MRNTQRERKKKIPVFIKLTLQWEKQIIYKINKIQTYRKRRKGRELGRAYPFELRKLQF